MPARAQTFAIGMYLESTAEHRQHDSGTHYLHPFVEFYMLFFVSLHLWGPFIQYEPQSLPNLSPVWSLSYLCLTMTIHTLFSHAFACDRTKNA